MGLLALVMAVAGLFASISPPAALGVLASRCALDPDPIACLDHVLRPLVGEAPTAWGRTCQVLDHAGLRPICVDRFSHEAAGRVAAGLWNIEEGITACTETASDDVPRGECACMVWDVADRPSAEATSACEPLGEARDRCMECASRAVLEHAHPGQAIDVCTRAGPKADTCLETVAFRLAEGHLQLSIEACDTIGSVKAKLYDKEGIPTSLRELMFAGGYLENDRTLSECNIANKDVLHLVVNPAASLSRCV